jgi:hypothetical protein
MNDYLFGGTKTDIVFSTSQTKDRQFYMASPGGTKGERLSTDYHRR